MTQAHPLDRPVWHALTTRQAKLAQGDPLALRLTPEYGPFAAASDASPTSLERLAGLVSEDGEIWLVETDDIPLPPGTIVRRRADLHQMIAPAIVPATAGFPIVALTEADATEMRALAMLTEPGPFLSRTHRLGDFLGVKIGGRLVAMAGERMKPDGFTEVSAVCTHPDWRGRGYAAGLMRRVAQAIVARGETPFLHVYPSNTGAIALYRALGFTFRRAMTMVVLARDSGSIA
jgi:predicted GNAT family acetyltransferase